MMGMYLKLFDKVMKWIFDQERRVQMEDKVEEYSSSCSMCGQEWCSCCPYCHVTPCECSTEDEDDKDELM